MHKLKNTILHISVVFSLQHLLSHLFWGTNEEVHYQELKSEITSQSKRVMGF